MTSTRQSKHDLFAEWSDLNNVMCDWRSKFDNLREMLPKCQTREEVFALLAREGYSKRYPLLPDWLK